MHQNKPTAPIVYINKKGKKNDMYITQKQYDKINISVLNISIKTKNNLKSLGINTFKDLHDADLMNNYNEGAWFSHKLKRRILDSVKEFMVEQHASK